MPAPDIALVKAWCSIDGTEFDAQLPMVIDSATRLASHMTGRDYLSEEMPTPVQQWVCAQVASTLPYREAIITGAIVAANPLVDRLLDPYRTYQWTPPAT